MMRRSLARAHRRARSGAVVRRNPCLRPALADHRGVKCGLPGRPVQRPERGRLHRALRRSGPPVDQREREHRAVRLESRFDHRCARALCRPTRTALLLAYQPIDGLAPSDWSGDVLTAASRYSNPANPMAAATGGDKSLAGFMSEYSPKWDGILQLRIYLDAANEPVYSLHYPALDIRVTGSTWHALDGGPVNCNAGTADRSRASCSPPRSSRPRPAPSSSTTAPGSSAATKAGSTSRPPGRRAQAPRRRWARPHRPRRPHRTASLPIPRARITRANGSPPQ